MCFQNPANLVAAEYRNNVGAPTECQICSKKGHTAIIAYTELIYHQIILQSLIVCQILKFVVSLQNTHSETKPFCVQKIKIRFPKIFEMERLCG